MKAAMNFATPAADGVVPFLLDTHWTGTRPHQVMVDMHDARDIASSLSFDREGFTITRLDCEPIDFADQHAVDAIWRPAVCDLVKRVTGASFATLFAGPLLRFSNTDPQSRASTVSAPARAVHSDLGAEFSFDDLPTSPSADRAVRDIAERYGDGLPQKWKIFNYWQMISPPPQDTPLALCALDSVSADDLLAGHGRFCSEDGPKPPLPKPGEPFDAPLTFFRENERQRWYYVSNMQPGEALIFQTLDPADQGKLKGRVPHCAFDMDPRPEGVVARNSVEIRAIVAYD